MKGFLIVKSRRHCEHVAELTPEEKSTVSHRGQAFRKFLGWLSAEVRILEWFGTVDFDPAYDYKAERKRKR